MLFITTHPTELGSSMSIESGGPQQVRLQLELLSDGEIGVKSAKSS